MDSQMHDVAITVAATSVATTSCTNALPKALEVPEETSEQERFVIVEAWKHSNFFCRNYILSGLQDDLCNMYSGTKTTKELWEALEQKYKTRMQELKSSSLQDFWNIKMINNKFIVSRVQELQVAIHDLLAEV
ncbi:hypothetical protein BC332_30684 [Capsicum chinense]|nr:hypothetical protein BC332_30684 [Capsicum chinense]